MKAEAEVKGKALSYLFTLEISLTYSIEPGNGEEPELTPCTTNTDCNDTNPCTTDICNNERCDNQIKTAGTPCTRSDGKTGTCQQGICEVSCAQENDYCLTAHDCCSKICVDNKCLSGTDGTPTTYQTCAYEHEAGINVIATEKKCSFEECRPDEKGIIYTSTSGSPLLNEGGLKTCYACKKDDNCVCAAEKETCSANDDCCEGYCSYGYDDTKQTNEKGHCCPKEEYWDPLAGSGSGGCIEGEACNNLWSKNNFVFYKNLNFNYWPKMKDSTDYACCSIFLYGKTGPYWNAVRVY